jgi:type IV secretory pathway VirB3-like protein
MSRHYRKSGRGSAIVILVIAVTAIMYWQGLSTGVIFNTIVIGLILLIAVNIFYHPIVGVFRFIGRLIQKKTQTYRALKHSRRCYDMGGV